MRKDKWKKIVVSVRLMWEMDRQMMIFSFLAAVIEAAVPFIGIFLSGFVLDGLQTGEAIQKLLAVSFASVSFVFALTVLEAYCKKRREVHIGMCGQRYDTLMSMKTISMDFPLLDSPAVNDIRARIRHDNDWGAGFYSLAWQLPELICSVTSVFVSAALLVPLFLEGHIFSDAAAVALLVVFAAVIVFQMWFQNRKTREKYMLLDDPAQDKSYFACLLWKEQDYHHGKDIRTYGARPLIEKKLQGDVLRKNKWIGKLVRNGMQSGFSGNFSMGLLQIISYLFVVIRAAAGALSVGSVVKYAGIIYRFSQSAANVFTGMTEFSVSCGRQASTLEYLQIEDVLPKGTLPVEKRAFCDGGDNEYEIEFRDVSFRYPGAKDYTLRHINLRFRIGERMAVVGKNGSGKTTLIKLLCRLYDPTEGVILLNGIDIRKYDYEEYMGIFSVVFQDFKLFSFSLGQNVAACTKPDEERVKVCMEKAGAGEWLAKMPAGIETCLYKDFEKEGVEISGGEAQKIALARALYKNAPFVILDEPTAALDPVAEYEIYARFNEIVQDKTTIYISHRLSSCRFCDEIVVFDGGGIVQRGSHEELVSDRNGRYYELWHAQAKYYK